MNDWVSEMGGLALGSRFRRLSEYLSGEVRYVYKKLNIDLNPRHFPVLSLLYSQGKLGLSTSDMASELSMSHVSISQTVKQLEEQGYCSRKPHKTDDRILLINLTKKADNLLTEKLMTVWHVIKEVTEERLTAVEGNFWTVISSAEEGLSSPPLGKEVIRRLESKTG